MVCFDATLVIAYFQLNGQYCSQHLHFYRQIRMNWDDLKLFLDVSRHPRLADVSARTGLDATTISRRLRRLETDLGLDLFERTPKGHVLTPNGQAVADKAEAFEHAAADVAAVSEKEGPLAGGRVRIGVPEGLGSLVIGLAYISTLLLLRHYNENNDWVPVDMPPASGLSPIKTTRKSLNRAPTQRLALLGILIASGALFFLRTDLTDALNPVAEAILGLPIRSNVFLYVFLPTLLFQVTLDPEHQAFKRQLFRRNAQALGKWLSLHAGRPLGKIDAEGEGRHGQRKQQRRALAPARIGGLGASRLFTLLIRREKPARDFKASGFRFRLTDYAPFKIAANFLKLIAIKRNFAVASARPRGQRFASQRAQQQPERNAREQCKREKKKYVVRRKQHG